jgi:hypothetical protein
MFKLNRNITGQFITKNAVLWKIIIVLFAVAGLMALITEGLNKWNSMDRTIQKPIVVFISTQPILISTPRSELEILSPIAREVTEPIDNAHLTEAETVILRVFGERDFQVARSIAKAESGLRAEAFHANSNGSIDLGLFQINSTHFNKKGCSMAELITLEGNAKCAYSIWKEQGWSPWVVFQTGAFRSTL